MEVSTPSLAGPLFLAFMAFGAGVALSQFAAKLKHQDGIARGILFFDYLLFASVIWLVERAGMLPAWLNPKGDYFSISFWQAWLSWGVAFVLLGLLRGLTVSHRFSLAEAEKRIESMEMKIANLEAKR